jgi:hypothetical protein
MRIDGVGNVGIGTIQPYAKLDVQVPYNKNAIITSIASNKPTNVLFNTSTTPAGAGGFDQYDNSTGSAIVRNHFAADGFSYINGGHVSIGTTNYDSYYWLRVEGPMYASSIFCNGQFLTTGIVTSNGLTELQLGTNGAPQLRIAHTTGNVGIGTAPDPVNKLQVSGSALVSGNIAAASVSAVTSGLFTVGPVSATQTNAALTFATGTISLTERMRITAAGDVGIGGTPAPGYKLQVQGEVWVNGNLTVTGGVQPAVPHPLVLMTSGVDRLHIDTVGNVGIGQTIPQAKLHVNGNVQVDGGFSLNGNATTGLTVQNGPISTTSAAGDITSGANYNAPNGGYYAGTGSNRRLIANASGCFYA